VIETFRRFRECENENGYIFYTVVLGRWAFQSVRINEKLIYTCVCVYQCLEIDGKNARNGSTNFRNGTFNETYKSLSTKTNGNSYVRDKAVWYYTVDLYDSTVNRSIDIRLS